MRTKKEFIMHQVDNDYMAVAIGKETQNFNGLIRINQVGAFIWNLLQKDITKDEIINAVCENYENAPKEEVEKDVTEFLQKIKPALIYSENEI